MEENNRPTPANAEAAKNNNEGRNRRRGHRGGKRHGHGKNRPDGALQEAEKHTNAPVAQTTEKSSDKKNERKAEKAEAGDREAEHGATREGGAKCAGHPLLLRFEGGTRVGLGGDEHTDPAGGGGEAGADNKADRGLPANTLCPLQGGDKAEHGKKGADAEDEGNDELVLTDKEGHCPLVNIALNFLDALVGEL